MAIFPFAHDQTIAQMWSNGVEKILSDNKEKIE